jgi:hypothetical protein
MADQHEPSIDRISRMFGRRGNRRQALAQLGGAGALVVGATSIAATRHSSAQVGDCSIDVRAFVTSSTLCGSWFDATLAFAVEEDGAIDTATLTITDSNTAEWPSLQANVPYPVVGTAVGRIFTFRAHIDDGQALTFQGVAESPVTGCDVIVAGSFTGPIGCIDGTWSTSIEAPSEWCACCCDATTEEPAPPIVTTPVPPVVCEKGMVLNKKTGRCEWPVHETPTTVPTEIASPTPEPSPTVTSTPEPTATSTPEPTPTATPERCPENSSYVEGEGCFCNDGFEYVEGDCVPVMCSSNEVYLNDPACELSCVDGELMCAPVSPEQQCFCAEGYARDTVVGVCIIASLCGEF